VKLLSGDIIEINESSVNTVGDLRNYFEKNNEEFKDSELIFFDNNEEKLDSSKVLVSGESYNLFVNDFYVNIYFDKTIRLEHQYNQLPKKAMLGISLADKDYNYIYNELRYNTDDDKWDDLLDRYNLFEFYDFDHLSEDVKITLIIAYLRECLCLSMIVIGYEFIERF
jgi:hypothetical protein